MLWMNLSLEILPGVLVLLHIGHPWDPHRSPVLTAQPPLTVQEIKLEGVLDELL